MEGQPKFIKDFSKQESPDERDVAATTIKALRAEHFAKRTSQTERQSELQQVVTERGQKLIEQLETIKKLKQEIGDISESRFRKISNYFQLKKLRADAIAGRRTYEELKQQQEGDVVEEQSVSQMLETRISPELQEAEDIIKRFYRNQKEKWAHAEYTKEDIVKYFSEEHLASLPLDDYVLLLKRFPSEMVTHVTRQGIRDHFGHPYHTAGVGEYADGFMKIVEDGRLRSTLGVALVEREKEQAIARFLHLDEFKDKKEALEFLAARTETQQGAPGSYVDRMAIHFATEEVADEYYGSERNNEIFIIYPSTYIASQYYFSGQLNKSGGGYWNDQWVWANEEHGIDINAGIIFIPEDVRVDKKTGSRYKFDENKNPIKDAGYQTALKRVIDSVDFNEFADQVMRISGKLRSSWDQPFSEDRELFEKLEPFRQKLEHDFGITDRRLQFAVLDYGALNRLSLLKRSHQEGKENPFDSIDTEIEDALKKQGILYEESMDTVSSKDFWEAYFANSKQRPSKVVYYKGSDPTNTLLKWRKEHGLSKRQTNIDAGFPERHIQRGASQATVGLNRFKVLAEKVIDDFYSSKESSATN